MTHFVLRSLRVSECLFETNDQELRIEVFQSLNDRGVELTKMDKVRARIVGRFQGESDQDKQIGRWDSVVQEFGGNADDVEEFLAHYFAATEKEFETVTDAKNELLEAFRLKNISRTSIKSRLANPGDARDFLEELQEYAVRYREITNADLVDDDKQLNQDYREECESILRRLNGLGTSQWRPFVMYVYQKVTETPGQNEFLRDILKTVENITFRVAISPHVATVVDSTYPKSTQKFIELERSGSEFDVEKISRELIDNIDSGARQVFGEDFADSLISESNWQNNQTKQLFLKLADEYYRRENRTGITKTGISDATDEVHIEHILPLNFFQKYKQNPYAWPEFFFSGERDKPLEGRIDLLRRHKAAEIDSDSDGSEVVERVVSSIQENFVRDLGNMMLLDSKLNQSIKNRLFSVKLREYHSEHAKDLTNVVNEFFSEGGAIDGRSLNELSRIDLPDDETDPDAAKIVTEFNKWWNYERAVDRKAELITEIIDSLSFSVIDDEFETIRPNVEELVREDYNTRFMLMSA
ncbi:DUF1524 domain-containing protein [Halobaculum halobium]